MPCSAVCARYDRRHGHCRERTYGGEQRTSLLLAAACLHQPELALCVCASSLICGNAQTCNSTWIVQRLPKVARCPSAYSCVAWHIPSKLDGCAIADLAASFSLSGKPNADYLRASCSVAGAWIECRSTIYASIGLFADLYGRNRMFGGRLGDGPHSSAGIRGWPGMVPRAVGPMLRRAHWRGGPYAGRRFGGLGCGRVLAAVTDGRGGLGCHQP